MSVGSTNRWWAGLVAACVGCAAGGDQDPRAGASSGAGATGGAGGSGGAACVDEVCNGVDDDCNGIADDGIPDQTCGLGVCSAMAPGCADGRPVDCTPLEPAPVETCDGLDDDCDGTVDEGCDCVDGEEQDCYTSSPRTLGVGACKGGTQTCADGSWGYCEGEVTPSTEVCNGIDDDCDAAIDEDDPDLGAPCDTGLVGACAVGVKKCVEALLVCEQSGPSGPEVCDGLDNDCDGFTDEGNPDGGAPCVTGMAGECGPGTEQCVLGAIACVSNASSLPEQCDGKDNDCDGTADEGNPEGGGPCQTGQPGECAAGIFACVAGVLACEQVAQPAVETCDGKDNDCDGSVDEGAPSGAACNTGLLGVCGAGVTDCSGGMLACNQTVQPSAETCNSFDDDCDGATDEGNPGGGVACNTGLLGECAAGVTQCSAGTLSCVQSKQAAPELCDGKDNDCDGSVDEGNPQGGGGCNTGVPGVCAAGVLSCQGGALQCQQTVSPTAETCDGLDNDCDGVTDDGNPGGGAVCNTGLFGVCAVGTSQCSGGQLACNQTVPPAAETCDGLDNDCDGVTDEGNPGGGAPCNTGLLGECAAGVTQCSAGTLACAQTNPPGPELCDAKDNDCDGAVDEGNPQGGGACNTGLLGECAAGTLACQGGALACQQTNASSPEVCDAKDNDCDGAADEGNPGGGAACNTGLPGICAPGTTACQGGVLSCNQNQPIQTETCDLEDDDCDGVVDDGFDLTSDPNNCGACGTTCGSATGGLCCSSTCSQSNAANCGACGHACVAGMLVINELMIDPSSVADSVGEWFEIYNPNAWNIDLRGFVISDLGSDTHTITSALPIIAPAGGYVVLGVNANVGTNGGVAVDYQYSGIALGNSGDELVITAHGVMIDQVVWGGTFDAFGKSKELGVNQKNHVANDNLANWCDATTPYGLGDLGTPKAANACAK